ncbi:MAG: SCO family protein [Flavobacteriales bacterium]|nr:SCO family protein [Flavobacteriales bacterium]
MRNLRKLCLLLPLVSAMLIACTDNEQNEVVTQEIKKDLPIYGEKDFIEGIDKDTLYHTIESWSFVNQDSSWVKKSDYEGKPYVAYFFFSNCPKICPKINSNMKYFQEQTKGLDFNVIAHTVDPERDTVDRLKFYGDEYGFDYSNYNFVTGDKQTIYELGINSYLVPNQEDALAPGGFLHSEKLILIDSKGRIRGYYEGTEIKEVDHLIEDLKLLIKLEENE